MTVFFFIDEISAAFEEKELENLQAHFDKVVMVTYDRQCLRLAGGKLSVEVIDPGDYNTKTQLKKSLSYLPQAVLEFFKNKKYIRHSRQYLVEVSTFLRTLYLSEKIHELVKKYTDGKEEAVLYSFWFNDWANALSLLKTRLPAGFRLVTRAHGTDLYEERVLLLERIAFRSFYLKNLDKVFSVSQKGTAYLKARYPAFAHKIFTSYLGTEFAGVAETKSEGPFTLVTCAKVRKVKRLHLVPQILKHVKRPLRWIHIGGEAQNDPYVRYFRDSLLELKDGRHELRFLGDLKNEEVLQFYLQHKVDLFLSVSLNEGLPVSMMEAISVGLPIMATDVGGCNEVVTEKTGVLIPKEFDSVQVAAQIEELMQQDLNILYPKAQVVQFWKAHFDNARNFEQFLQQVLDKN